MGRREWGVGMRISWLSRLGRFASVTRLRRRGASFDRRQSLHVRGQGREDHSRGMKLHDNDGGNGCCLCRKRGIERNRKADAILNYHSTQFRVDQSQCPAHTPHPGAGTKRRCRTWVERLVPNSHSRLGKQEIVESLADARY